MLARKTMDNNRSTGKVGPIAKGPVAKAKRIAYNVILQFMSKKYYNQRLTVIRHLNKLKYICATVTPTHNEFPKPLNTRYDRVQQELEKEMYFIEVS